MPDEKNQVEVDEKFQENFINALKGSSTEPTKIEEPPEGGDDQTGAGSGTEEPRPPEQQEDEKKVPEFKVEDLDPIFQPLVSSYGESGDYTPPEEIITGKDKDGNPLTDARKYEILREEIIKNEKPSEQATPEINDPFLKQYLTESQRQDFNEVEFFENRIQQKKMMDMKPEDFLKVAFRLESDQRELGWTDEVIQQEIEKMSPIARQREADRIKADIKTIQEHQEANAIRAYEGKLEEDLPVIQKGVDNVFTSFMSKAQNQKTLGGFELSEEDRTAFLNELPEFTKAKIVEVDGRKFISSEADKVMNEIVTDPTAMANFSVYLWLHKNNKLNGLVSDIIEQKKEQIIEKLEDKKTPTGAGSGQAEEPGFDKNAFLQAAKKG